MQQEMTDKQVTGGVGMSQDINFETQGAFADPYVLAGRSLQVVAFACTAKLDHALGLCSPLTAYNTGTLHASPAVRHQGVGCIRDKAASTQQQPYIWSGLHRLCGADCGRCKGTEGCSQLRMQVHVRV